MESKRAKFGVPQFGLRRMLICIALVAIALAFLAMNREREWALQQLASRDHEINRLRDRDAVLQKLDQKERAIRRLEELRAAMSYDYQWSPNQNWIPNARNPGLPWLQELLGEHYAVKPVEVELSPNEYVGMKPEEFTDTDAELISVLDRITWLALFETKLTDEGLMHLGKISALERLDLEGSPVTAEGVKRFRDAHPGVRVVFSDY